MRLLHEQSARKRAGEEEEMKIFVHNLNAEKMEMVSYTQA
jgi:hypothetical protein